MADNLKDIYSRDFLLELASKVETVYSGFQTTDFVAAVLDDNWSALSVRGRSKAIAEKLGYFLPPNYEDALEVLFKVAEDCSGFPYLFFPDFVTVYGHENRYWDLSMLALETFTRCSSSEFAIRPFLLNDPERTMKQMTKWALHSNEHVRRLASEGCRPRLPWAEALPLFKANPEPVLSILNLLKEDRSLYVRKSVANNLNDISKDHPDMILKTARTWLGISSDADWIVRRGCRTLIKNTNPDIMTLFGYVLDPKVISNAKISSSPESVSLGEQSEFTYTITLELKEETNLRIEYAIDFVKSNGQGSRKAFHISDKTVTGKTTLTGVKRYKWHDLTTRRHYAGHHHIVLLVNGIEVAKTAVTLSI